MDEIKKLIEELTTDGAKVDAIMKLVKELAEEHWIIGQEVGYENAMSEAMGNH